MFLLFRPMFRQLCEALSQLPRDHCEVLVLRHFAGLSPTEIAMRTGRTEGSINGSHHRAQGAAGGADEPRRRSRDVWLAEAQGATAAINAALICADHAGNAADLRVVGAEVRCRERAHERRVNSRAR
jgi:hypothetical protein